MVKWLNAKHILKVLPFCFSTPLPWKRAVFLCSVKEMKEMKTQNTKTKHWMDGVGSKSQNVWFSWFDANLPRAPASPRREPCCCHVHLLNRIILRCKIWDGCIIFFQFEFLSGKWIRAEESECWYGLGNMLEQNLLMWLNLRGERVRTEAGCGWRSRNHPWSTLSCNIFSNQSFAFQVEFHHHCQPPLGIIFFLASFWLCFCR